MKKNRFTDGLDEDIKKIVLAQIRNLWTHASTALEGNSLTLGETSFVLEEGLTVSGKPLKDHRDAEGHAKAIEWIYRKVESENALLAEQDLFELHRILVTEPVVDIMRPVGGWKKEANFTLMVRGDADKQEWREYPDPDRIPGLMREWLDRFDRLSRQDLTWDEAFEAYADLHLSFVTIHPFWDGNGRMARLVSNIPVLWSGYPPLVVPLSERKEYLDTLSRYQSTISDLPNLRSLKDLPENRESALFLELCRTFAADVRSMVDEARRHQSEREKKRKT